MIEERKSSAICSEREKRKRRRRDVDKKNEENEANKKRRREKSEEFVDMDESNVRPDCTVASEFDTLRRLIPGLQDQENIGELEVIDACVSYISCLRAKLRTQFNVGELDVEEAPSGLVQVDDDGHQREERRR